MKVEGRLKISFQLFPRYPLQTLSGVPPFGISAATAGRVLGTPAAVPVDINHQQYASPTSTQDAGLTPFSYWNFNTGKIFCGKYITGEEKPHVYTPKLDANGQHYVPSFELSI